ncbi:CwfJ C-terminus 1-domain-containing protein-like protein [Pilobolus umbonatus]|nr:CwfJ C-terminus 1-domain-containing protein-like protein [Pilobolus umbonatus]
MYDCRLVTGSTNSKIKDLFGKAKQINEKYGPFDVHFCVGNLFSNETSEETIEELINGKIDVPIMTYFINGDIPIPDTIQSHIDATDGEVCTNLHYLGKQGILSTAQGLKIAFLSGIYGENATPTTYTKSDIQKLCLSKMPMNAPPGVDLLLTYEWPKDITSGTQSPLPLNEEKNSAVLSDVSASLKPRYHFASSQNKFYEREPYKNIISGVTGSYERPAHHVTRFIGLGDILNEDKQRWFYAFNLVPLSKATKEALEVIPPNTTPYPFSITKAGSKRKMSNDEGTSFFFDASKKIKVPPADYICKICNTPGHFLKDCPQKVPSRVDHHPPEGYVCNICKSPGHWIKNCPSKHSHHADLNSCWFCLSNPKLEKHLIVSIGSELYMTLAKGPIISPKDERCKVPGLGHVLIIPITHYPTFGKIPMESQIEVIAELERFKNALRRLYDKYDQDMVIFEVSRESINGLSHAHIQVIPVPRSISNTVEPTAKKHLDQLMLQYMEEAPPGDLPYFKMEFPNGKSLVHIIRPRESFNIQIGRKIMADVLGYPEREDWRICVSEEEEKKDTIKFKEAIKPYDFTLDS